MTDGTKTSEFWLSLAGIVAVTAAQVTGHMDPDFVTAIGLLAGGYALSRGIAKKGIYAK